MTCKVKAKQLAGAADRHDHTLGAAEKSKTAANQPPSPLEPIHKKLPEDTSARR
jgi:hypothetical protein